MRCSSLATGINAIIYSWLARLCYGHGFRLSSSPSQTCVYNKHKRSRGRWSGRDWSIPSWSRVPFFFPASLFFFFSRPFLSDIIFSSSSSLFYMRWNRSAQFSLVWLYQRLRNIYQPAAGSSGNIVGHATAWAKKKKKKKKKKNSSPYFIFF